MKNIENPKVLDQLKKEGIDPAYIQSLYQKIVSGKISPTSFVIDKSKLRAPQSSDFDPYEKINTEKNRQIGLESIKKGELACLWLNGGAATRYFDESKITPAEREKYPDYVRRIPKIKEMPKGVTEVIQGLSFLELKIRALINLQKETKGKIPIILMNSFITDAQTDAYFEKILPKYPQFNKTNLFKITQKPSIPRFTHPDNLKEIDLYTDKNGNLSYAPAGHGEFVYLLKEFLKTNPLKGVKYLFFVNIDNLGATIDPAILGYHIEKQKPRTIELATKEKGDKGGAPCFVDNKLVVVEQMKFPDDFDQDQIHAFNTNTFWFDLDPIRDFDQTLPLIMADKKVNGDEVIQLEQISCDIDLPSNFIEAHRFIRFWPTKRYLDLALFLDPTSDKKRYLAFAKLLKERYNISVN
jgi:UTP--glucose-1-phosphate uridylyltransferase